MFFPLKALDAQVVSAMALTIHRSQGSTFEDVFVDVGNVIKTCRGGEALNRAIYTAATRASRHLALLDSVCTREAPQQ